MVCINESGKELSYVSQSSSHSIKRPIILVEHHQEGAWWAPASLIGSWSYFALTTNSRINRNMTGMIEIENLHAYYKYQPPNIMNSCVIYYNVPVQRKQNDYVCLCLAQSAWSNKITQCAYWLVLEQLVTAIYIGKITVYLLQVVFSKSDHAYRNY